MDSYSNIFKVRGKDMSFHPRRACSVKINDPNLNVIFSPSERCGMDPLIKLRTQCICVW